MLRAPYYGATFTLLYGDPDVKEEQVFLQPYYALLEPPRGAITVAKPGLTTSDDTQLNAHIALAGPQPIFGGAIISSDAEDTDDGACQDVGALNAAPSGARPPPLYIHRDGTPYLATLLNTASAARVKALRRPYPAPGPRSGALCVTCPDRGTLLLHGGLHDMAYADTWEYDVRTRRWRELRCTGATPDAASDTAANEKMPPPAYGQAGAIYHDDDGQPQLLMLGGFNDHDSCCSTLYGLCLRTRRWREVETTIRFPRMWGATAQTLMQPCSCPVRLARTTPGSKTEARATEEEEEVVVFFGGTTRRSGIRVMFIVHPCHRLTEEEVYGHVEYYLDSVQYGREENRRIIHSIPGLLRDESRSDYDDADSESSEDDSGEWRIGPSEYDMDAQTRSAVLRWRQTHEEVLMAWRQERLRRMVGKVWVECLHLPRALLERRRPCSGVYRGHFMFIFGGRHHTFYNDFWVFNAVTRMWIQIRAEVPRHWLQSFFAQPANRTPAERINRLLDHVREKQTLRSSSLPETMNRYSFYASAQNSSAASRTGACMVVDSMRCCVYVYGGFALIEGKHYIFRDLHAYHITQHVWRRVYVASERDWDARFDAGMRRIHSVRSLYGAGLVPVGAAEEVNSDDEEGVVREWGERAAAMCAMGPLSYLTQYIRRQCASCIADDRNGVVYTSSPLASQAPNPYERVNGRDVDYPPPLLARRPCTTQEAQFYGNRVGGHEGGTAGVEFVLPVLYPTARTMACLVDDPVVPGSRFFLLGGRQDDVVYGDLFELRIRPFRWIDQYYHESQAHLQQRALSTRGESDDDGDFAKFLRKLQLKYKEDYRNTYDGMANRRPVTVTPTRLVDAVGRRIHNLLVAGEQLDKGLVTQHAGRVVASSTPTSDSLSASLTHCINMLKGHRLILSLREELLYTQPSMYYDQNGSHNSL